MYCIVLYCIVWYCIVLLSQRSAPYVLYCILQLVLAGMDKLAHMKGYEDIRVTYLVGGKAVKPEAGRKGNKIINHSQVTSGEKMIPHIP